MKTQNRPFNFLSKSSGYLTNLTHTFVISIRKHAEMWRNVNEWHPGSIARNLLRSTKQDWAKCVKWMVDELYSDSEKIVLVMDNLNTHKKASLYETFEAPEAKCIADKLEIHYTPKHGS